jgi:hypothetical protein
LSETSRVGAAVAFEERGGGVGEEKLFSRVTFFSDVIREAGR